MIRLILVLGTILVGFLMAVQQPIYALFLYTWNAYFRPESWVYNPGLIVSLKLSQASVAILFLGILLTRKKLVFDTRVFFMGLFLAWCAVGSLTADIPANHAVTIHELWKVFLVSYLYLAVIEDVKKLRLFVVVIVLSLGLEAAKQGWLTMLVKPGAENHNGIPFLGTRNPVAVGMLMLTPLCVALAQTAKGKWERRLFWFLAIGILYRGITTYSRGALLAAVALAMVWWWRSRYKIRSLLALGIVVALIGANVSDEWVDRMASISEVQETNEASAHGRLHFWEVAVDMANDHPLFGIGVNAFNDYYDSYDFTFGDFGNRRAVHSSWFGVLAESGYIGLLIFIVVVFLAFRSCQRVRKLGRDDPRYRDLGRFAIAFESALVAWAIGGAFTNFHYNEMLWNFIALTMVIDRLGKCAPPEDSVTESNTETESDRAVVLASSGGRRTR